MSTERHTPIHVTGSYLLESSGMHSWTRSAFDAGRRFEHEMHAWQKSGEHVVVFHGVVMVPAEWDDEQVSAYLEADGFHHITEMENAAMRAYLDRPDVDQEFKAHIRKVLADVAEGS